MSIDMSSNFLKLLIHFRRHDLVTFANKHASLYEEAREKEKHLDVTTHYYGVMSAVIQQYFGGNFHFAPPTHEKQKLEDALKSLHLMIGKKLKLEPGKKCADVGCGIGGVIRDLAPLGADMTGVTIAANEVQMGNEALNRLGLSSQCRLIEGDAHCISLESSSLDAAYAIYSLKYIPHLQPVFKEISRILRPGGLFVVYDLLTSPLYDPSDSDHRRLLESLSYSCGMPPLHSAAQLVSDALREGLEVVEVEDLEDSTGQPFHYCFSHSPLFMWLVKSNFISSLIKVGQTLRVLPKGFHNFNSVFLSGTVRSIVESGQKGILNGSSIYLFRKL